jgi:hypothetical protein
MIDIFPKPAKATGSGLGNANFHYAPPRKRKNILTVHVLASYAPLCCKELKRSVQHTRSLEAPGSRNTDNRHSSKYEGAPTFAAAATRT